MTKVFEDAFVDLQSELISLCLKVAEREVDKVYIYTSIEKKSKMLNAFFIIDGSVKTLNQLGINPKLIIRFLTIGTGDLEKIISLCSDYNMPVPTEMKMCYETSTGKYDGVYKYDEVCSANTGFGGGEVFMNWISEIKNNLSARENL